MLARTAVVLLGLLATVAASPLERIVGGSLTNVQQYPFIVSVQVTHQNSWMQACGGSILHIRAVLSAAHCFIGRNKNQVRFRIGTSFAHSGGVVHNCGSIGNHPNYSQITQDNDIAVLRSSNNFNLYGSVAKPGIIAGPNYNLADNQNVWAAGWGLTSFGGQPSEQLRHVNLRTVNQNTCRDAYGNLTANMLCANWPHGGRDACIGDSGSPLLHNNVIVGVLSFGNNCALPNYPGVYARVSRYSIWIQQQ